MPPYYASLVLGACLQRVVKAIPQVSFPIAQQVPPAAIVEADFNFSFSAQTFVSAKVLEYSLAASSSWLRLNSETRTLSGRPSLADIGTVQIQILAKDNEGETSTDFLLTVLASNSVKVQKSIVSDALDKAGTASAPSTLSLYPQTDFSLVFGPGVFKADTDLNYHAASSGRTPLPAWIAFDPAAVAFSGRTPDLLTPQSSPQSFGFFLAAGQKSGVSQASFAFDISVTNHILRFPNSSHVYQITRNEQFSIPSVLQSLRRDDVAVDRGSVSYQASNLPSWLALIEEDLSFSGTVPESGGNIQFQLSVKDDQNNVAVADISLHYANSAVDSTKTILLQPVTAVRGQKFAYTFEVTDQTNVTEDSQIDLGVVSSWLVWTANNKSVTGTVPEQATSFNITLITAGNVQTKSWQLFVKVGGEKVAPNSTAATDASRSPSSTSQEGSKGNEDQSDSQHDVDNKALGLKIALPLVGIAILLCAVLLLLRKIRQKGSRAPAPEESDHISDSARSQSLIRDSSSGNIIIVGASSDSASMPEYMALSPPPRVDFTWSSYRRPLSRLFSLSSREDRNTPTTRSSWSDMLNEVESPTLYGYYNKIDGSGSAIVNDTLPSPPSRPHPSVKQSSVSIVNAITKQSGRSTLKITTKFDGRRKSGLGHGVSFGESSNAPNRGTLRQVPLSPLTESPLGELRGDKFAQKYTLSRNPTSHKTLSTTRSGSNKLRSIPSMSSRYDDPDALSTEGSDTSIQEERNNNTAAKARWDDRDWQTMSNLSDASSRYHGSVDQRIHRDVHESGLILPMAFSTRTIPSQKSQANSLRFI